MLFFNTLLNFGALLVPILYLLCTHFRGPAKRLMIIGVSLQMFWSLGIWAVAYFAGRAGNQDAYKIWGMMPVVNAASLIFYIAALFNHLRKTRAQK